MASWTTREGSLAAIAPSRSRSRPPAVHWDIFRDRWVFHFESRQASGSGRPVEVCEPALGRVSLVCTSEVADLGYRQVSDLWASTPRWAARRAVHVAPLVRLQRPQHGG
jgi:hypothetical protein